MALVKCYYCKQQFDREKEPFKEIRPRRYAHAACAKNFGMLLSEDEKTKIALETYIKNLFGTIPPRVKQQLKTYTRAPYKYTEKGILLSLKYWYEVKKADIRKSNGGIGIVPTIYNEANNYYTFVDNINKKNKNVKPVESKTETVHITPPERRVKKSKAFAFLDEEGDDEQ